MPQVGACTAKRGHRVCLGEVRRRDRPAGGGGVDVGSFAQGGVQVFELVTVRAAVTEYVPPGVGDGHGQDRTVEAGHLVVAGRAQCAERVGGA